MHSCHLRLEKQLSYTERKTKQTYQPITHPPKTLLELLLLAMLKTSEIKKFYIVAGSFLFSVQMEIITFWFTIFFGNRDSDKSLMC